MFVSPAKQGKIMILIIVIAILIIIYIVECRRKKIGNKYIKSVKNINGELYKFVINECNNEETIKSCILISMSDFSIFTDNIEAYIVEEVKAKIKNNGYAWLNLKTHHENIYNSSYPIELAISDIIHTQEVSDILYHKYISIIYDGFHYGMQAEQEAIEYYQKHGSDAEGDDLHPAEIKKEESSDETEEDSNNIVIEDE